MDSFNIPSVPMSPQQYRHHKIRRTMTAGILILVKTIGILSFFPSLCQSFSGRAANVASSRTIVSINCPTRDNPLLLSLYKNDRAFMDWSQNSRIDVRNLLTQRSFQSFMFLCEECRDPHSGRWIEEFLGTKNLLQYHGKYPGVSFHEKYRSDRVF